MKVFKFVVPAIFVVGGLVVNTATSLAKPAYSKKEGKPCTTCHVKSGSKDLNDTGKYYGEHKKLPSS